MTRVDSGAVDGWGDVTFHTAGQAVEPRTFTEADPISSLIVSDWADADAARDEAREGAPQWGTVTYVGRGRHRPKAGRAPESAAAGTVTGTGLTDDSGVPDTAVTDAGLPEAAADGEPETNRKVIAASGSMAVASLVSRVTGFLRSALIVVALGVGGVGNAYNSGNNLPNMIYELLLGGVLSSVLIPLLVSAQAEDDDDGTAYTQRLLSLATVALGAMTLLAVLAAPWIAAAFVPAGSQRELTSIFATLLLPEIFFYGLGAMFMAVLNIRHSYKPGAWAPVLNNVIMIATVGIFLVMPGPKTLNPASITTPQILVIGVGTTLGIAAQALVLIPALRKVGFRWAWRFRALPGHEGRMKEVGSLAGWVLAYVVVSQVGVTVIQVVGNRNGGFSIFTYVDLLFQMPYGVLVVSLLTAIMPRLSRAAVRGDTAAVVGDLSLGARLSAVALVPVTAGLIVLGPVLTITIFAYGETSIANAHLIGSALAYSAFGLLPFALVMLQLRVFYAMRDGRTPTIINLFMVGTKVVLILVTDQIYKAPAGTDVNKHPSPHAVEWLNIATSFSYVVGAIVGHVILTRRLGRLGFSPVVRTVIQVGFASVAGGAVAYGLVVLARHELGAARFGSFTGLVAGAVVGLLVMAVLAWRMRIPEVRQLASMVRRG